MKNKFTTAVLFPLLFEFFLTGCTELFSPDISEEKITILGPVDSLFTSADFVTLWWENSVNAGNYELQVVSPEFTNPVWVFDTLLSDNSFEFELSGEGLFAWRLRGRNESSETQWTERIFIFDRTSPFVPSNPNHHLDTLFFSVPDTLKWSSGDAPISGIAFAVSDSVVISRVNDSASVLLNFFVEEEFPREAHLNPGQDLEGSGWYFWRVTSFDRAGNRRQGSWFKFFVQ